VTDPERAWWREAVVYQIYPRSFMDADGDGVGDLRGVAEKVDYIDHLGADVVWLNPVYDSPQVDNGYDIRDYRSIDSTYGTMDDWETLRDRLHERDIRLVMDIAFNHTSDEHEWFRRSRRGEEPYRDYYVWEEGDPDERPNDWQSMFGGPAWKYDDEREAWYLHLFHERMPDLNWRNPAVREAIYETLEWWLDRGIDGFRLDVINLLSKPEGEDGGVPRGETEEWRPFVNGPRIHEYVGELHDRVFAGRDIVTIGETIDVTPDDARRYVVEDGLDMVFPFEHMDIDAGSAGPWDVVDWDLGELAALAERWQTDLDGGWIGLYLGNHDQPRLVSRFGDDGEFRVESAKMLATFLLTLRGTPFVYQGDEIGMTNAPFEELEEYRDPATTTRVRRALQSGTLDAFADVREAVNYWSRDNARTPMQWSDEENAGFTTGEPWIKVNPNYRDVNVERDRADEGSVFSHYRRLLDLRADEPALVYGAYDSVDAGDQDVLAYRRHLDDDPGLLVLLNFFDGEPTVTLPEWDEVTPTDCVLSNYPELGDDGCPVHFRPYEGRIYRLGAR
jgi:oligo-1,6-glucosidase